MKLNVDVNVRNKFEFRVIDSVTMEVKEVYEAFNTVTDYFLDVLCSGSSSNFLQYLHFGTGVGTPSMSDIKLFTWLGQKSGTLIETDQLPPVMSKTISIRLAANEFVGANITEVGISASTSSTSGLMTHAMIVDSEGAPISITKTEIDIIDIYATVYFELMPLGASLEWITQPSLSLTTASPTYPPFMQNSWNATIGTYGYGYQKGGDLEGMMLVNPIQTISGTLTADTTANTRTYKVRFNESASNAPIKSILFNSILAYKADEDTAVWAGKTFTDMPVAIGDGVATAFNLAHRETKNLVLKIDGVAVPTEAYEKNDKLFTDISNNVLNYSTIGGDLLRRATVVAKHPTVNGLFVFYDAQYSEIVTAKIDPVTMTVEILSTTPYMLAGASSLKILFLDEDVIFMSASGNSNRYIILDFNVADGTVGPAWTRHANMPHYDFEGGGTPKAEPIYGSSFALFHYQTVSTTWYPKTLTDIYSFSLNKTTKVFGENINIAPGISGQANHVRVNPAYDMVTVCNNGYYTYNYGTAPINYPIEKATGVFGEPIVPGGGLTDRQHYTTWSIDGLYLYAFNVGDSGPGYSGPMTLTRLKLDPATLLFTSVGHPAGFLTQAGHDDEVMDMVWLDGEMFIGHKTLEVSQGKESIQGTLDYITEIQATGITTYSGSGYNNIPQGSALFVFDDKIVMIIDAKYSTVSSKVPSAVFWERHKVAKNHLVLNAPLADGAVLTADYHVDYIPKDLNHILDLEVTYSFMGA